VDICTRIGRHSGWIRALVSAQIDEPTLGRDFMIREGICFNIGSGEIFFKGDWIKLIEKPWIFANCSEREMKREFKNRLHCSGCGRKGHTQETCYFNSERTTNKSTPPAEQSATGKVKQTNQVGIPEPSQRNGKQIEQGNSGKEFHCYGCGQQGHIARNCPNKPPRVKKSSHSKDNTLVKGVASEQPLGETSKFVDNLIDINGTEFATQSDEQIVQISGNRWMTQPDWSQDRLTQPTGCIVA